MQHTEIQYETSPYEDLINQIFKLQYPDFGKAEALRQHIKTIALQKFPDHFLYSTTIENISFKTAQRKCVTKSAWNDNVQQLLNVAYSMKNDSKKKKNQIPASSKHRPHLVLLIVTLVAISLCLWFFNSIVQWSWLENHPRRIPIYLTWQLSFILAAYFYYKNKKISLEGIILPIALFLIPLF